MTGTENPGIETAIADCVRAFYGEARCDPMLGPVFDAQVHDWDVHLRTVSNFWSKVLLGTGRYAGHPYAVHVNLPVEPEHIERWLELFAETAEARLPAPYAEAAIAKARMMGESFRMGLFPFEDANGRPSRHPA